jgi:anaerobic selenocysteine-containing dehydrogenase
LRPSAEEAAVDEVPVEPPAPPVALHEWSRMARVPAAAPRDSYALRVVAAHTLYGNGRISTASPSLARLSPLAPELHVSARDRDRIGVDDGTVVRVVAPRATLELPVRTDPRVPEGVALLAVNRDGPGAHDLIDLDAPVTDVRLETL